MLSLDSGAPLDDKVGVFVVGIDEAPPAMDRVLSGAVAVALKDKAIPASAATANRVSFMLQGMARLAPDGWLGIHWQLIDADGEIAGLFDQVALVDDQAWQTADPGLATFLARDAAERVAGLMSQADPAAVRPEAAVAVAPVEGAPGDGDDALRRAMAAALMRRQVPLDPDDAAAPVTVAGRVAVRAYGAEDLVEITWSVHDRSGAELGAITQRNAVPAGTLDGPWGAVAVVAADNGADGVVALLEATGYR